MPAQMPVTRLSEQLKIMIDTVDVLYTLAQASLPDQDKITIVSRRNDAASVLNDLITD